MAPPEGSVFARTVCVGKPNVPGALDTLKPWI
jgi:hypothetical protein